MSPRPVYDIEAMGNWLEGALSALVQAGTPVDSFTVQGWRGGVAIHLSDGRVISRKDEIAAPNARPETAPAAKVYLIAAASGQIKIGIAQNVRNRLRGLQNAHGDPLSLLVEFEGGREMEQRLHKALAAYRLKGEWFRRGPWVDALLAGCAEGEGPAQLMRRVRETLK